MTDTSNAAASPDANWKDGTAQWTPPPGAPSPLAGMARRAAPPPPLETGVWQRGRDQPTTVASLGPQPQRQAPPAAPPPPPPPVQTQRPKPMPWTAQPPQHQPSPAGTPPLSPTGAPPPLRQFTPYIPAQPIRDHDDWGTPAPFAREPQPFEVPSINHGVGSYFAQNGSGITALLGSGLVKNSGAFMKAYMQGREFATKQTRDDMQLHAMELDQKQQEETDDYAEVFNAYNANGYKPLNGVRIEDALARIAQKYNDTNMQAVLANGPGAAYKLLQNRDAKWQDGHAANKKAEDTTAQDELWGLKPAQPADGDDASGLPATLGQPARSAAEPGAAPTSGAPTAKPGQPGAAPSADEPGDTPIDEGAAQIFKGNEPGSYVPPDVKNAMALKAADMRKKANAILADPNIKPEEVIPEIKRQLGATVAADAKGYSEYRSGPGVTGGSSGGKEQDYWNLLGDLVEKSKPGNPSQGLPGWNKSTYQAVRDFRDGAQKPNSPIQRIPTSVEAATNVRADLAAIQARDGSSADVSPETLSGAAGKDPLYAQLKIDWIRYNEDIDVLTRGTPSVGMAEQAINTQPQIPYFGSITGYRAAVRRDMDQAKSRVDELHGTWNQYQTGDVMPGFNQKAEQDMDRIRKMDFTTGALPGEVVPHPDGTKWRYLGANPENPGDVKTNWRIVE
jgi:hypothetical protein